MPKTDFTPQFTSVSAITSVVVRACAGSGSSPTKIAPSRMSTGNSCWPVSSWPPGGVPVSGSKSQPCQGQRIQHWPSAPASIEPSPKGPPWCGQRLSIAVHCPSKCTRQSDVVRAVTVLTRPSGRSPTLPTLIQSRSCAALLSAMMLSRSCDTPLPDRSKPGARQGPQRQGDKRSAHGLVLAAWHRPGTSRSRERVRPIVGLTPSASAVLQRATAALAARRVAEEPDHSRMPETAATGGEPS